METFLQEASRSCSHGTLDGIECLQMVHETCLSMVSVRGYREVDRCTDVSALVARMAELDPVVVGRHSSRDRSDLLIFFLVESKVGIKLLRILVERHGHKGELCLVSVDGPTPFTRRDEAQGVCFMTYKQLFVDITRHHMVPRHTLVPHEKVADVAIKYNVVNPSQWPQMLLKDPMAQFCDFRPGDLVHIHRTGWGTNGACDYYRLVV